MQREFVVDGEVFKRHHYFYCVNCEARVARIEDYVPNVRDLLYGGYFTNLSHVVIIDQPKFLQHEDGNNLTTAQIYCLQCNDQIGWRLISASRQTDYFMEGRYFMRFEKLMFQNRVTVRSYIIGSAYREGLIQVGGANAQVGGTNAQVIGGVNARIGGVIAQPIRGANAQVGRANAQLRRVNAQVGGANAQAIGGSNAQEIGGANTQVIGGVNAQVRRATGHPLLVLNEEQVGEANDLTLLYLNEEPAEEANETGPNDEDGAPRLDLNMEPEGPNGQDGALGLDLNEEPVEEANDEVGAPSTK